MKATRTTGNPAQLFKPAPLLHLLIIFTALALFTACKKDKGHDPDPDPSGDKELLVNFSTTSVAYNLVDSGFVVLKKQGAANQFFKRFEKKTDAISFSIGDLSAGNWTAEMYIFARFNGSAGRRYRQDKTFTIQSGGAKENITLAAPTGAITDAWKPYAFFRHEQLGVSIAVALDNTDPHFDIEVKDTRWDLFYIERYANKWLQGPGGPNAKVAEYIWSCDNACYTSDKFINNNTGFLPFIQEVGNNPWDNGLIIVVVADNDGADVQFSHRYNK
ncbi:hypothetical protein D3H65_29070 [Paraflavitalea soli]|uniref:Uncharacterized protein n=1 Tax=Paraflavitalea soli TaxID=2315862 RepID=A0A3B7N6X8_9BACT|nr:hypothetical protein [Paraflavitalea soli]AXY77791.1 hypothetical protein D3H65_29070 [Paraflavitalea soli]